MEQASPKQSIYDLLPLDVGGVEAREGFAFQDHVAAGFCLDLLSDSTLREVWCETLDDVTLIWGGESAVVVEFVQVKGSEMDQLWTIAKLCEKKGGPHCILEKSLAQDRCNESVRFRIVTSRDVGKDLRLLKLPFGAPGRTGDLGQQALEEMHEELEPRVGGFCSSNGHDYTFWTKHALWEVRHAVQAVQDANIVRLAKALEQRALYLAVDQVEEMYAKLLKKVWDASRVNPLISLQQKRITTEMFETWLQARATELAIPQVGAEHLMRAKMEKAALAEDMILVALEQRRQYRREQLSQKYVGLLDQHSVEGEVLSVLQLLKSRLDNGVLQDDGVQFHTLCLEELERLRIELKPPPTRAFMQGCMYSIAARCLHRFRRVTA